jgi:hypothetical protein
MCSKTRGLSQERDTAQHVALHTVLHAFFMSFSLSNQFFKPSTQKSTQRFVQHDVAFVQRDVALYGLLQYLLYSV